MTPQSPREAALQTLHDMTWTLMALLFAEPDSRMVLVPRQWVAQWRRELLTAIEQLRRTT